MKYTHASLLVPGIFVCLAVGCTKPPPLPVGTTSASRFTELIEFPRQTLIFQPTREDMSVKEVNFSVACSNPDNVRVNGVRPEPAWVYIQMKQVAKNQFEMAPLKIELANDEDHGLVCVSVKVYFNEITTQYDSMYYEKLDDRYALVSYCTGPIEKSEFRARYKQNQVASLGEFKAALSKPFIIRLKQVPLRAEWSK